MGQKKVESTVKDFCMGALIKRHAAGVWIPYREINVTIKRLQKVLAGQK